MKRQNLKRGFTIVELLIVLGVFAMLTSVVLARYRTFDTNAKFANASEDIILALRQAQVYGVGAKGNTTSCGEGTTFECAYGVHFSMSAPHELRIFVDLDNNNKYTDTTEDVTVTTWDNTISLTNLLCNTLLPCANQLDVTFKRPNPDAIIADSTGGGYNDGKITISNGIKNATITITEAGQISLQ